MENADMVGTDLTLSIHSYILKHIENSTEPSPLLKEKVANGELGFKSGKGFQEWTAEEIAASKKGLLEYLLDVTKK
jgi:3-hydroxybutyryl-CoA dehydrogenase